MKSAVTEPESRAPSTTIRQDLCHGAGVHGRHKGWFSEFRTEQSQKIRQPVASLLETTPQKGPPRQAEAAARRHSQGKAVSLQVPCATPSSNFWELEVCDFCDISPPPRQADAGAPPPRGGRQTTGGAPVLGRAGRESARGSPPRPAESYKRL